ACPAGLRVGPAGLGWAPALSRTLRDGAGSRSSRPTLTTPRRPRHCRYLDSRPREIAGLNRNGQLGYGLRVLWLSRTTAHAVLPARLRDSIRLGPPGPVPAPG